MFEDNKNKWEKIGDSYTSLFTIPVPLTQNKNGIAVTIGFGKDSYDSNGIVSKDILLKKVDQMFLTLKDYIETHYEKDLKNVSQS